MAAGSIAEVIEQLADIVDKSKQDESPLGYFPALYLRVTREVGRGISDGVFDDGARMARLGVIFANRYLDAYEKRRAGVATTQSWAVAFDMAESYWPTVLQHLLAGINAHILLDLGIAAAQTAPGDELDALEGDFDKINGVLFSLIDLVQDQLAQMWLPLAVLDRLAGRIDENFAEYGMERVRDSAWETACGAAYLQGQELVSFIARRDGHVRSLGELIRRPGLLLNLKLRTVRLFERGSVAERIDILSG